MALDRVVALVDMDCFYVQVEQRLNPSLIGKPCAVVQYNHWKGGGIIAVSYEARKYGVTRSMRGADAQEKCPDIMLARVPEKRGKADLTRYRDAGAEVIDVLQTFCEVCERASVDEAYLDLTEVVERSLCNVPLESLAEQTLNCCHIVGFTDQTSCDSREIRGQWLAALADKHNRCLAVGALVIAEARKAIKDKTGFTCSAGVAHNKMLAKLGGGANKPNQQTIVPQQSVATFFQTIQIPKVRFFGGKYGQTVMNLLQVEHMGELTKFSRQELQQCFGEKPGSWLYDVCRGIEHEVVRTRRLANSTGCGKNFMGKMKLVSKEKVHYWIAQLAAELSDRLKNEVEKNNRVARLVSVRVRNENNSSGAARSFPLKNSDPQSICDGAIQLINTFNSGTGNTWHPAVISLALSAGKFEDISKSPRSSIVSFFSKKGEGGEDGIGQTERGNVSGKVKLSSDSMENDSSTTQTTETSEVKESDKERSRDFETELDCTMTETHSRFRTSAKSEEVTTFGYERDEIDQSILGELPEDIRNEIKSFLEVQKPTEKGKRFCNGIEKYCTYDVSKTGTHSAAHLQENDGRTDSCQKSEPPRKRPKNTIDAFFVAKEQL